MTGANRVAINTSADGTFYSAGSDFTVMLTAGTVDGTSVVGYVVGRFTLRESAAYDAVSAGVGLADGAITAAKIASNAITDAKISSGALTAPKFAAGAFDAVWSVTTRVLTAGTNIVLSKGTGVTGFNDLDAAGVRTAVGLSSANLDTQFAARDTGAVATAVWGSATRTVTNVSGFSDTGVNDRLGRILADTDTGLKDEIATLDTGLRALITASAGGDAPDTGAIAGAVWGFSTRVLTAGTNISLAKGTGVTGFNDLDAGGIRTAVGLSSANLDTQLAARDTGAMAAAVWGFSTRVLTAGTNISLAKGSGVTGFNDLSQADVRTAVGLVSANLDTQLASRDTGAVASAVWGFSSRALTAFNHDTGVSSTVWNATSRTVTNVTGFSDTGVNDRLSKIGGDADTGLRDAISDARYVDTGPTADLAVLRAGVNVASIRSDTGAASRLQKLSGNQLKEDGTFDTGTGQATNTFNVQANVTLDTGTPINVQVDIPAIVSGVWGAGSRTLTDIDTGVITSGVWSASARTLTNYHDTGIDQSLALLQAGVHVSSFTDTGVYDHLTEIAGNTSSSAVGNAVWTSASRTLTDFEDTGTLDVLAKILGDADTGLRAAIAAIPAADTGAIADAVWAKDTRSLTNYHDTGIDQDVARVAARVAEADTGLRSAINGIQVGVDTGAVADAVWNAQKSAHIDTGTFGEHLGGEMAASSSVDTGAIANAVWGKDARTLTDYHDTGINQRLDVIRGDVDTGLRAAISAATYVDTGPTADLAVLRAGVNVSAFSDTGVNNRLARIQAETDTGLRSAIQAAVYSDTGPTADLAQIIADTTTLKAGVNVTSFADTGVNNRLSRIQAEADTGIRSHITAAVPSASIAAIKTQTDKLTFDTGGEVLADIRKVNNVTVAGTGDTGLGDTWRPAAE
ncbi:hypothetical protein [Aquamicrobium sp.]|uniref:beta strand repeat-containing protein n=1 Tax=Aquamicrobium sp. TaxID=1872579 RepID=UPI00258E8767|nr:hypothetical protein [Aquamicrobium sp.]MCK9549118.1 hypothetical protein [Aquamicrobium sp.]